MVVKIKIEKLKLIKKVTIESHQERNYSSEMFHDNLRK